MMMLSPQMARQSRRTGSPVSMRVGKHERLKRSWFDLNEIARLILAEEPGNGRGAIGDFNFQADACGHRHFGCGQRDTAVGYVVGGAGEAGGGEGAEIKRGGCLFIINRDGRAIAAFDPVEFREQGGLAQMAVGFAD